MEHAREARRAVTGDSALRSYQAEARGFVYFFVDREDTGERVLVKADQIALEVYWRSPGQTHQRIVGRRDEKQLPTNIHYHLDHLTVVQDDFGDRIRLGEGDEVASVIHPVAPGSASFYDYRVTDSVTVSFPGGQEPVRVYEVQVRPRSPDAPGFLGSIFLDRDTGAIVRMRFTFTSSAYVDPYLDYIRISLDNSRWLGKFWLPYRQQVEIRRELPQLDLPAGSLIRGRYEIGGYRFDQDLPDGLFRGPRVTALPPSRQKEWDFQQDLYSQLDREGLRPTPELSEVRRTATEMAAERYLSGLGRLRFYVPDASHVLRYDRAEGLFLGAGVSYRPSSSVTLRPTLGYAFARERPALSLDVEAGDTRLVGFWNELRDLGGLPGSSRIVNTLAASLADRDYLDPWFASGVRLARTFSVGERMALTASLGWERQASATDVLAAWDGASDFRPVLPVEEGDLWAAQASLTRELEGGHGFRGAADVTLGHFRGEGFATLRTRLGWRRTWLSQGVGLSASAHAGATTSRAPAQELFLLGGRETLPGYDYRSLVGDRFWLLRVEGSRDLVRPWVSLRAFGSMGRTYLGGHAVPEGWQVREPRIARFSAGVGLGLLWNVLQIDLARGLNGGRWVWIFSVNRTFWSWL